MPDDTLDTTEVTDNTLTVNDETPAPPDAVAPIDNSPSVPSGVEDTSVSPADEPTPEAPPAPRTLRDVYNDVMAKGPDAVTGSEYAALARYQDEQAAAQQAEQARQEYLANLFPTKRKDLIDAMGNLVGWVDPTSTERLALEKIIDDHLAPLEKDARTAITTPLLRQYGQHLWDALGRTEEAARYIQSINPKDVVQAAIEVGKVIGGGKGEVATADEIAKWHEGKAKPANTKLVTVADAQKAIDAALDIERRAHGRTAPGPTGVGASAPHRAVTYAELQTMKSDEIMALPSDVFQKAISGG